MPESEVLDTDFVASLPDEMRLELIARSFDWDSLARPEQRWPEEAGRLIVIQPGRGWGKTRTALEWIRQKTDARIWRNVVCVGSSWADVIGTMVEGTQEAPGLLSLWPPGKEAVFKGGKQGADAHVVTWNGARIMLRSAERPEALRGINADGAWCDEVDHWSCPRITPREAFSILELAVRTGPMPTIIVTSTPKPSRLVAELRKRPGAVVIQGSTYDNSANLSEHALEAIVETYEGTRWGRQEIYGEILEDVEGALVTPQMIEAGRVEAAPEEMRRVVVGVDPSGSSERDAQGVVAVGLGEDGDLYLLDDASCSMSPEGWGRRAVQTLRRNAADRIVVEKNYGGDMVVSTIRTVDRNVSVKAVTATRGKVVRFEPLAALYEQGRVHHVGHFPELEDQIVSFTAKGYEGLGSPDRADAMVWAALELIEGARVTLSDLYPEPVAATA